MDDLRMLNMRQHRQCFEFHDQVVETQEIELTTGYKLAVLVSYRECNFALKWNPLEFEFNRKRFLVGRFQKSMSKRLMDFHRGTDNGARAFVFPLCVNLRNLRFHFR